MAIIMTSFDLIWRLIEMILKDKEIQSEVKDKKND